MTPRVAKSKASPEMERFIAGEASAQRRIAEGKAVPVDSFSAKFKVPPGVADPDEPIPADEIPDPQSAA